MTTLTLFAMSGIVQPRRADVKETRDIRSANSPRSASWSYIPPVALLPRSGRTGPVFRER
jgi:hypothetical protein